jgi:lysozyme
MKSVFAFASLALIAALLASPTKAAAMVEGQIQETTGNDGEPQESVIGFQHRFRFPEDARPTSLFGIDVSHHQGDIDWSKVSDQSVVFAYVKATQGSTHLDVQFASHWESLEKQGNIFRGAYHFMSATADPAEQARNFLETIGEAASGDLPPCLDLEWDFQIKKGARVRSKNGVSVDRWAALSSDEIVSRALVWLKTVEAATGRKPIIYTNSRWWKKRIKDSKDLAGYRLWIADYADESLRAEEPWVPEGFEWVFWQISDRGILSSGGVDGRVDANYYRGTHADFIREFGLSGSAVRNASSRLPSDRQPR